MIKSKICENDNCQASFVPEKYNQLYCNICEVLIHKKEKSYIKAERLIKKYEVKK